MDCTIGIKILFLNWRLKCSNGRLMRSNECWLDNYLHKPKVHTRNTKPLAAVGFSRFDITGNFSQFSGTFVVHLQHLFLRNYSLQFYNNRLLFYVEKCLQLIFCWVNTNQARHVKLPTVCYLHVNIRQMSIINQIISIPYLEHGYHWNITIFNLKVESWFQ